MLVAFVSYGNDSIALIQRLHESESLRKYDRVLCAYSDTGWASSEWPDRVERGEALARSYGFEPHRISSMGFVALARLRKGFPRQGMQFCTSELKIVPAQAWLDGVDPAREAVCAVGIRREESRARASWPEWTEESEKHDGRSLWSPLVRVTTDERDALLRRAGFEPLPHRSMECFPCVNSNRADLRLLTDERIDELAALEASMGFTGEGKPRTIFRPYRHAGAVGIREVVRWARSERGQYEPPDDDAGSGCDSGFCGT